MVLHIAIVHTTWMVSRSCTKEMLVRYPPLFLSSFSCHNFSLLYNFPNTERSQSTHISESSLLQLKPPHPSTLLSLLN
jgi:hypothetical protein